MENKKKNHLLEHEALMVQTRSHINSVPEIECPTVSFNEIGVSREDLITMQKADPTIKELLDKDYNKINLNNHHILINDLTVRCNRKANDTMLQIIIPEVLKVKILKMAHDDPTSGHLGKKKNLQQDKSEILLA